MSALAPVVLLLVASAAAAPPDSAARPGDERALVVLPGASREISHARSASRDTALLAYQLTPYSVLTAGGDVGLLEWRVAQPVRLRLGFFGMLELQSDRPIEAGDAAGPLLPSAGATLWRGVEGLSVAASLPRLAQLALGDGAVLEATLSYRHESDHFTGSREGNDPLLPEVPDVGNFFMPDVAVRLPAGALTLELRLQEKLFVSGEPTSSYVHGPGLDAGARYRLSERLSLFTATFAEYLVGGEVEWNNATAQVPDLYLVRDLTGVILPGPGGEVQLFAAIEVGHGKGLLAFREERRIGGGVRLDLF